MGVGQDSNSAKIVRFVGKQRERLVIGIPQRGIATMDERRHLNENLRFHSTCMSAWLRSTSPTLVS
jgi:hypothetical protein